MQMVSFHFHEKWLDKNLKKIAKLLKVGISQSKLIL